MRDHDDPIAECDNCGADLYDGVPHDCPITGNIVIASTGEGTDGSD